MYPAQMQAPANGLMFIDDIKELDTLQMAPGSISQPYFLKDEDKFIIVTFDNVGGSTKEMYSFKKEAMPATAASGDFVTREYFDRKIGDIMEAINGKHVVQQDAADVNQAAGPVQGQPAPDPAAAVQYPVR
jgi:hypothetical protein